MTPRSLSTPASDCAQVEELLGVVALNLADLADTRRVNDHLRTCERCAAALADVTSAADALRHVSGADLASGLPGSIDVARAAPPAFPPGVVRRRRRVRSAFAVAAAAVALGIGVLGVRAAESHSSAAFAISARATSGVAAHGHVTATARGSFIELSVSGLRAYQWCQLVAIGGDGRRAMSSGWYATLAGTARVGAGLAIEPGALRHLELVDGSGRTLIVLPIPS